MRANNIINSHLFFLIQTFEFVSEFKLFTISRSHLDNAEQSGRL